MNLYEVYDVDGLKESILVFAETLGDAMKAAGEKITNDSEIGIRRRNGTVIFSCAGDADGNGTSDVRTADERFATLGFIKNKSDCYGEDKGTLSYERPKPDGMNVYTIKFHGGAVYYGDSAMHCLWMEYPLIEAIRMKLKELGWEK